MSRIGIVCVCVFDFIVDEVRWITIRQRMNDNKQKQTSNVMIVNKPYQLFHSVYHYQWQKTTTHRWSSAHSHSLAQTHTHTHSLYHITNLSVYINRATHLLRLNREMHTAIEISLIRKDEACVKEERKKMGTASFFVSYQMISIYMDTIPKNTLRHHKNRCRFTCSIQIKFVFHLYYACFCRRFKRFHMIP